MLKEETQTQWVVRDEKLSGRGIDVYSYTPWVPDPSRATIEAYNLFADRADKEVSDQQVQEYLTQFFPAAAK